MEDCRKLVFSLAPKLRPQLVPREARNRVQELCDAQIVNKEFTYCEICGAEISTWEVQKQSGGKICPLVEANLQDRVIRVLKTMFCCGLCQICLDFASLLQMMICNGSSNRDERTEILWHLMTVNKVDSSVMDDETKAWKWLKEILTISQVLVVHINCLSTWKVENALTREPFNETSLIYKKAKELDSHQMEDLPLVLTEKGIKRRRLFN